MRAAKGKVEARNSIPRKLSNSKLGTDPWTMRSTALVLRYSATECVCPVWGRSTHTNKMCLSCLGPLYTYQQDVSVLSGAALHIPTRYICPVWGRSTHTNKMCLSCLGPLYTYQQHISVLSGAALHIPTRCIQSSTCCIVCGSSPQSHRRSEGHPSHK